MPTTNVAGRLSFILFGIEHTKLFSYLFFIPREPAQGLGSRMAVANRAAFPV